eukprot:8631522-Ditylum_brightwellii.AAC.1
MHTATKVHTLSPFFHDQEAMVGDPITNELHKSRPAIKPGQCISVKQMKSSTPGFVAQLKRRLILKRYTAATIFTDHYSRLTYIHLQYDLFSKQTLEAKRAFKI